MKKIDRYVDGLSLEDFCRDSKTIDAVTRNLSIIGEAANNMPKEIILKYPHVPWSEIVGMKNKVIHEYFGVDEEIMWKTIKDDLQELKTIIIGIEKDVLR